MSLRTTSNLYTLVMIVKWNLHGDVKIAIPLLNGIKIADFKK